MTNLPYPRTARTDYPDSTAVTHDTSDHHHDFVGHHRPQMQLHHLALHDWGIARGLEVSASDTTLTVAPGVAIDQQGQLIVLASGGYGDTGGDPLAGQHNPLKAPVPLFTGNMGGDTVYVIIRFSEIPQSVLPAPDTGPAERLEQAPWLRLRTRTELAGDEAAAIPFLLLAIADIDQNGRVVALRARDDNDPAEQHRRRLLGERVERLAFERATVDGMTVKTLGVAEIALGDGDALHIKAPQTTVGGALRVTGNSIVGLLTADQMSIGAPDPGSNRLNVEGGDVHFGGALTVIGLLQGNLAADLVNTAQLRDGAVTAAKLQAGSVGVNALVDGAVTTLKVADAAITAAKIASDAVASAHLQNGAITAGKVADSAITEAALANNVVTTTKIQDNAISSNKLIDLAVTDAKLAANSVTADKLQDGSVVAGKLADGAVTTLKLVDQSVTAAKIAGGSVGTAELADGAVNENKLAQSIRATLEGLQNDLADLQRRVVKLEEPAPTDPTADATTPIRDIITDPQADITIKRLDDLHTDPRDDNFTNKNKDDFITVKNLDDGNTVKKLEDLINPSPEPHQAPNPAAAPFALATPHHTMAWLASHPALRQSELVVLAQQLVQHTLLIREFEQQGATQALSEAQTQQLAALQQSYADLLAEYETLMKGGLS